MNHLQNSSRLGIIQNLPDDALVSPRDLCSLLDRCKSALYADVKSGRINPPLKFGKSSRWRLGYVRKLLENGFEGVAI